MNIPPAIVPIPLPGAAAGAPQPNWANIGNSLNTLAAELPNVPNMNPMAAILAMHANILQLVDGVNAIQGNMVAIQEELRLTPIRIANGCASSDAPIHYPAPFVGGGPLPTTPAQARNLTGQACTAALDALAGAPGLVLLPPNAPAAVQKAHLLAYLGILS